MNIEVNIEVNIAVNNGVNGATSATPATEQVTGMCELHRLAAAVVQLVDASRTGAQIAALLIRPTVAPAAGCSNSSASAGDG